MKTCECGAEMIRKSITAKATGKTYSIWECQNDTHKNPKNPKYRYTEFDNGDDEPVKCPQSTANAPRFNDNKSSVGDTSLEQAIDLVFAQLKKAILNQPPF
jgi:hypothetical protein